MLFDWFTFGAQVLNFLILVWVLKHFLYKPILNAIDSREKLIAKELADAAAKKAEAQKEHEEFQHKNEEFDEQRAALLSKATDEAHAERQRLLGEARTAADALSAKRQEAMRNEARGLERALGRRTQQEVFAIARKALTDLAATSLEGRMVEAFTLRLRGMDGRARVHMGEVLKTASEPALIRSAFDLPQEQREAVRKAINETFSADINLRFETEPDLISGIDLSANGQRVGWNIESYLTSLDESVSDILKKKERPEAKAGPTPQPQSGPNPEAAGAPKPDAKVEPTTDTATATKPDTKVDLKPESAAAAMPDTKAEPKPDAAVAPTPDTKGNPRAEPAAAAKLDTKTEPKPEAAAAAKPEVKVEPKAEAAVAPTPVAKVDPKTEVAVAPKSAAKVDPNAETTAAPKPDTKVEPKPDDAAAPKPEATVAPKPNAKVEPKPEVAATLEPDEKVEPKPDATVAPTPNAKADPKPGAAVAPTPDAHVEPRPTAHAESTSVALKPEPQSP